MSFSRNDLELLINVPKGALMGVDDSNVYRAFVQALYALEVTGSIDDPVESGVMLPVVRLLWDVPSRDGGASVSQVAVARAHQWRVC